MMIFSLSVILTTALFINMAVITHATKLPQSASKAVASINTDKRLADINSSVLANSIPQSLS